MKFIALEVLGSILFILGLQGGIRVLSDETDLGFLGWVPGGIGNIIGLYVALTVIGGYLTYWADRKRRESSVK